jgi:hypothetical protein
MARYGWGILLLLLVACGGQGIQQKAKWEAQNILDYRFTLKVACFCPLPAGQALRIEVKNGVVASVKDAQTGQAVDPKFLERYTTIAKLFEIIRDAEARKADRLEVQYDPQFGFPTRAVIDYITNAADDELAFEVEGFEKE